MHLTVLICVNADSSKKIEPFVIGKSKIPPSFKHIKSFSTKFAHNKKSWMTGSLFENYLYNFDRTMKPQKKEKFFYSSNSAFHILLLRQIEKMFVLNFSPQIAQACDNHWVLV